MAKPKMDDPIGLVVSRHGCAAIIAGLQSLVEYESNTMKPEEVAFVKNLTKDLREAMLDA